MTICSITRNRSALQDAERVLLRMCEKTDCEYKVTNGLTDVKDILMAISNHLAAMHPASGGSEGGGGGSKSNAAIPTLEEGITEMAWAAWRARFDRLAVACKLSDKNPAYGRHQLSRPMRIVGPIQI